jgi:hypothetical protein
MFSDHRELIILRSSDSDLPYIEQGFTSLKLLTALFMVTEICLNHSFTGCSPLNINWRASSYPSHFHLLPHYCPRSSLSRINISGPSLTMTHQSTSYLWLFIYNLHKNDVSKMTLTVNCALFLKIYLLLKNFIKKEHAT